MSRYKKQQQGITLIELMIAVAISATLLGGLIEVYLGSKQSYNLVEESSRLQENGRFALDTMTREIRSADFWGCLRKPDDTNLVNNLNMADAQYDAAQHDFGEAITGFDNQRLDGVASNSDSISFGGAAGGDINVSSNPGQGAGESADANNGLAQYDIVIISDCSNGDIFQITNANPDTSGSIVHNTGSVGEGNGPGNSNSSPDCNVANKHCLSKSYTDAKIYGVSRRGFDIRPGANGNNALFQINDSGDATEIIENVENMQILYGEDTDADDDIFNVPNQYVNATDIGYVDNANPGNIENAVTVRVALLLRGERNLLPATTTQTHQLLDTTITTTDRNIYKIFSTTITIRNRALIDS